jgi:prophage regulatory protein
MLKTKSGHIISPARTPSGGVRFLRLGEVRHLTGLSTSRIYEMVGSGEFPRQFNISKRIVAWLESEVAAWQAARLAERDSKGKAA